MCICLFQIDLFHTKFYDKRDDFDFEIVNFPYLDGVSSSSILRCLYSTRDVQNELLISIWRLQISS